MSALPLSFSLYPGHISPLLFKLAEWGYLLPAAESILTATAPKVKL